MRKSPVLALGLLLCPSAFGQADKTALASYLGKSLSLAVRRFGMPPEEPIDLGNGNKGYPRGHDFATLKVRGGSLYVTFDPPVMDWNDPKQVKAATIMGLLLTLTADSSDWRDFLKACGLSAIHVKATVSGQRTILTNIKGLPPKTPVVFGTVYQKDTHYLLVGKES